LALGIQRHLEVDSIANIQICKLVTMQKHILAILLPSLSAAQEAKANFRRETRHEA